MFVVIIRTPIWFFLSFHEYKFTFCLAVEKMFGWKGECLREDQIGPCIMREKKKYNEHNLADKRDGLLMTDKSLKF